MDTLCSFPKGKAELSTTAESTSYVDTRYLALHETREFITAFTALCSQTPPTYGPPLMPETKFHAYAGPKAKL
jgi:hypothetical protein